MTAAAFSADCCRTSGDLEDKMVLCNFMSKADDMKSVNGDPSGLRRLAGGVSCKSKKVGLDALYGSKVESSRLNSLLEVYWAPNGEKSAGGKVCDGVSSIPKLPDGPKKGPGDA